MNISNIRPAENSVSKRKRIGRGNASGQGRTAGKGHKGYKSRSGASGKLHFEGGQMPLMRRLPKRGMLLFSKERRKKMANKYQIVNLEKLSSFKVKKIDIKFLSNNGLIKNEKTPVKILSKGNLESAIEVSAQKFSQAAIEKIEKAGGKAKFI